MTVGGLYVHEMHCDEGTYAHWRCFFAWHEQSKFSGSVKQLESSVGVCVHLGGRGVNVHPPTPLESCPAPQHTVNRCSELQSQHAVRCRYSDGQTHQPVHHRAGLPLLRHAWTDLHSSKQLLPPTATVAGLYWQMHTSNTKAVSASPANSYVLGTGCRSAGSSGERLRQ